uniref:Uncharacterized protein n=1 Tax=Accipiter nisus TaxID=211598 RepID=A0A8B9NNX1_9AVES
MARRALKLASLAAAASGIYLYGNKFLDPNDFGVVRVGRAIATFTRTWDFLHSLSSFPAVRVGDDVLLRLDSKFFAAFSLRIFTDESMSSQEQI